MGGAPRDGSKGWSDSQVPSGLGHKQSCQNLWGDSLGTCEPYGWTLLCAGGSRISDVLKSLYEKYVVRGGSCFDYF